MTDRATIAEPDLTELAPLVRVVTGALHETPLTLGTPAGIADLAATITVRVAAYVGREVLPPGLPADRAALRNRLVSALDAAFRTFASPLSDAVPEGVELSDHLADAVLAVLPEPADRAVVRAEALRMAEMALREQANHLTGEFADSDILHEDGPAATVATWNRAADLVSQLVGGQPQADSPAAPHPTGLTVPALARLLAGGAGLTGGTPPYDQLPATDQQRYLGQAWQLMNRADGGQQS
ncbi:hypothetical protein OZK63_21195 [Streptomyces sp. UMAF16]|nr:hypothetical protein [Streptomyces sp. UMAF16]